jgi:lysophospholipase L1-like esterase
MVWVGDSTTWQIPASGAAAYLTTTYQQTGEPLAGVNILYYGANGNTLANFLNNQPAGFGLSSIVALAPNLIIFSYGINDVRQGATSEPQLEAMLIQAVDELESALPKTDIILRLPNSFLSVDVDGNGYIVPNSAAQAYSDELAQAYRALAAHWPNVVLYDSRKTLFSDTCPPSSPLMLDQLHPSLLGYEDIIDQVVAITDTPPT